MKICLPLMIALCAACGPTSPGAQVSYSRVLNHTGATLALVGPDDWSFDSEFWETDCGADVLTADVVDGTLTLTTLDGSVDSTCTVNLRSMDIREITCEGDGDLIHIGDVTGLEKITVTGNGDLDLARLLTDALDLHARGNGRIAIADLQVGALQLDLGGTGDVVLVGAADQATFDITGNGNVDAQGLMIQDLDIQITGNGDATVTVVGTITGAASGSGNLDVFGAPTGTVDEAGSGTVTVH